MDQRLRGYLHKGERIRWQGAPARFELLEGSYRVRVLGQWILAVLFCGGTLTAYLSMDREKNAGVIALVVLVALVLLVSPLLEKRNVKGQHYWITDQRLILMCRDKSLYYMPLQDVDACRVIRDQTEWPCLAVGTAVSEDTARQLRWRACHPRVKEESKTISECAAEMVFYGIKNADAARDLLRPYMKHMACR